MKKLEQEILLWSIRVDRSWDGLVRILAESKNPPDWVVVLGRALDHRVLPLVHGALKEHRDRLGPESLEPLDNIQQAVARRSFVLAGKLAGLAGLLDGWGVPFLCLKGPVLAQSAYGDLSLRQFSDLDVLVSPGSVSVVQQILERRGFTKRDRLTAREEVVHFRREDEITYESDRYGFDVDVHWAASIRPGRAFAFERLFERRVAVDLLGRSLPALGPDDQLLYLCAHAARHAWDRLQYACDVGACVRSLPNRDWAALLRAAERYGLRRTLLLGLVLARDLTGTEWPAALKGELQGALQGGLRGELRGGAWADATVAGLVARVKDQLLGGASMPPGSFRRERFQLALHDRWGDRVRHALGRVFPPTVEDLRAVRLPGFLFPLYFLIRPLRLAAGAVRAGRAGTGR